MDIPLILATLASTLVIVLVAQSAAFILFIKDSTLKLWMPRLIALAVGVLLGDAFLHLLPEAFEEVEEAGEVLLWTLAGILSLWLIERLLHRHHDHSAERIPSARKNPASYARINLLGDGMHNFLDGALIAGSYLTDPMLGIATTIAIAIHEVPQEISDIAVLVHGGYEKRRAVRLNVLCAAFCIPGALLTLLLADFMVWELGTLLAFNAGAFIYIATADLMPLLEKSGVRLPLPTQVMSTLTGVAAMQALLWLEHLGHFSH